MTNRGTAKRMQIRLKKRVVVGDTPNTTRYKWVDPEEERKKDKLPHAERHPNDITRGIHLIKRLKREDPTWFPNHEELAEMQKAVDRGYFNTGVPGSVHYNGKGEIDLTQVLPRQTDGEEE